MRFDLLYEDHYVPSFEEIKAKVHTIFHMLEWETHPPVSWNHSTHKGDFRVMGDTPEPGRSLIYSTRLPSLSSRNAPGTRSYQSRPPGLVRAATKYLRVSIYIPDDDDSLLHYQIEVATDRPTSDGTFHRLSHDLIYESPGYQKSRADVFATDLGVRVLDACTKYYSRPR